MLHSVKPASYCEWHYIQIRFQDFIQQLEISFGVHLSFQECFSESYTTLLLLGQCGDEHHCDVKIIPLHSVESFVNLRIRGSGTASHRQIYGPRRFFVTLPFKKCNQPSVSSLFDFFTKYCISFTDEIFHIHYLVNT